MYNERQCMSESERFPQVIVYGPVDREQFEKQVGVLRTIKSQGVSPGKVPGLYCLVLSRY